MDEGEDDALKIRLSHIQQSGISRKNNLKCRFVNSTALDKSFSYKFDGFLTRHMFDV